MKSFKEDQHFQNIYGELGEKWLLNLPKTIQYFETIWGLRELKPYPNLSYNYVLEGFQDDTPIVLKLSFDCDALEKEAKALLLFQELGAVTLLDRQKGGLLLEKAISGSSLKSFSDKKTIHIGCQVIEKLQKVSFIDEGEFPPIERWLSSLDLGWQLPEEHLKRGRYLKTELLKRTKEKPILLHGDLHQGNILSHGNSWKIIDPKGVVGYPINECWSVVENPFYDLQYIADYFHYPFKDVVEWYYIHLVLAACWQVEDRLNPEVFLSLADSILPLLEKTN